MVSLPSEAAAGPDVRELRRQVREWRRGRADTRLVDALGDAYIAAFAALMLGSMLVNVVLNVRTAVGSVCTSHACRDARDLLPWLTAVGVLTVCLATARLLGPMLVSPAIGSWLLPAPVSRRSLLRPRLAGTGLVALLLGGLLAAGAATLGRFDGSSVTAFAGSVGALCLATVGAAVVAQARGGRGAQVVTWLLAAVVWVGLLGLAFNAAPPVAPPHAGPLWAAMLGGSWLLAGVAVWRALVDLRLLGRPQLTPGGSLLPSLSGALAGLDFALVYDVLVARRWRARSTVRSVAGRGHGGRALVWRDVVRLRRSPQVLVVLAACLVVPYLSASVGLGRVVVLVATGTAWVAGLGLFSALRVVSRTPGLARCLPMTTAEAKAACLWVPGVVLLVWALGTVPALHTALRLSWADCVAAAVAVGIGATATTTRWMTGRPPNYQLPMVTSPIGAVPPSLYVAAIRGFDVLLLVTAPLLISPTATGANISIGLSGLVVVVLVSWRSPTG